MSFLAPLYLLGALAIALPVLFHLIRRTTRQRTPFSSLMFLRDAPPRLTRRSRLEDRLLLALRALVLGLLALGFARPFLTSNLDAESASPPAQTVILLDTSASMRREGLWEEARKRVLAEVQAAGPGDRIAVVTFDQRPRVLVGFEEMAAGVPGERTARVRARLDTVQPGWGATRLDQALIRAAEQVTGTTDAGDASRREIVVVSDLQRGSELGALQGFAWPNDVVTRVELLEPSSRGNAGIQLVADRRDLEGGPASPLRIRVSNSADASGDQFRLGWAQAHGGSRPATGIEAYVPPGQTRVVSVSPPPPGPDVATQLRLEGDGAAFDNVLYVVEPKPTELRVVYLGSEPDTDASLPLFFLRRAFPATRHAIVNVEAYPADQPMAADVLTGAALIVATDRLDPNLAQALHEALRGGATMLFAPRDADAVPSLSVLAGTGVVRASEADPDRYALLGELDFGHPLLAPFATPAYSDFTSIHVWRYRRLAREDLPSAQVVAAFDSGDPALLEIPVSEGRLLVLTSCWHPADSQLALSSKFVPLLYSMLEFAGSHLGGAARYVVGDRLPIPAATAGAVMHGPDGTEVPIPSGATTFSETRQPGMYRLATAGPDRTFAVNLDPAETRTEPVPLDELAQLGVPFGAAGDPQGTDAGRALALAHTEVEGHQRLWRWMIAAALAAVLLETWLAGRTAGRAAMRKGLAA